jgi:hypothetical protein
MIFPFLAASPPSVAFDGLNIQQEARPVNTKKRLFSL